jgi:hypothetical protein
LAAVIGYRTRVTKLLNSKQEIFRVFHNTQQFGAGYTTTKTQHVQTTGCIERAQHSSLVKNFFISMLPLF